MRYAGTILVAILVLIGLTMAYSTFDQINREMQAIRLRAGNVNWPVADAQITECSVDPPNWEEQQITARPFVKYQYQIGDEAYESDQISVGSKLNGYRNDFALVRVFLDKFKVGSHHPIVYKKEDPRYAYLFPGVQEGFIFCDGMTRAVKELCYLVMALVIYPCYQKLSVSTEGSRKVVAMTGIGLAIIVAFAGIFALEPLVMDYLFKLYVPKESVLNLTPKGYSVGGSKIHPF